VMTMDDVDSVSVQISSDGTVHLTIRKCSGYSDEYRLQPREAKYLFNEFGTICKRVGEE